MRHLRIRTSLALTMATVLIAGFSTRMLAQVVDNSASTQPAASPQTGVGASNAAPAQPPQICGNNAFCYETNNFAATITSFRITTDAAKRQILDLSVRFQNKTAQQLVLGYVNGSGNASDDRGNRLVPWGPNASRGLGLVYGATFDPKFAVRPAGFGDAQFEFFPQGYPQVVGFTYTLDLSVAEINTFEGNQHTLGEEFPLHFQGLRNGSAGISPGFVPGAGFGQAAAYATSNPCTAAGGAGSQVASTVSDTANAISNIGSLFRKKKAQNAQPSSLPGCDPNAAAGVPATATTNTSTVQQAVSRTNMPPAPATNPLNPLASKPVQSAAPAPAGNPPSNNRTQVGAAPHAAANAVTTKPTGTTKPSPAKPKPQSQKPPSATGSAN